MTQRMACCVQYMAGGDLRDALDKDKRTELIWYRKGYQIALDIARGLHFLHSHAVRPHRGHVTSAHHLHASPQ